MTITIDPRTDTDTVTTIRAEYEAARADALPAELVQRLLAGESPVRIWREHRCLTLGDLADRAGLAPSYVLEIETGLTLGSGAALIKLARVLKVEFDDLAP
jgi:hypothetical protein